MGEKIKNMLLLRELGLPVHDFEVVKSPEEIKWIGQDEDHQGWCIRTDMEEGRKLVLPIVIHVSKEEVCKKILELKAKFGEKMEFIVYSGWGMKKAGNIMILEDEIIIEAVGGFYGLMAREGRCDVHYTFLRGSGRYPTIKKVVGDKSLLTQGELFSLLRMAKRVPFDNVVLEWSINKSDKIYFHDMVRIRIH